MFPSQPKESFSSEDRSLFSLLSRKTELVLEVLDEHGITLPRRISKPDLRYEVEKLLRSGVLQARDIASLLERLQGWGKQQIYLYVDTLDESSRKSWLNEDWVRSRFKQAGLIDIFNDELQVEASNEPVLFGATYLQTDGILRVKWAEFVGGLDRKQSLDKKDAYVLSDDGTALERIIYHAYLETYATDVSTFEWDIRRGIATFMIRKVSDRFYMEIRDNMGAELSGVTSIGEDFQPVELRKLLANLDLIENVNRRRLKFRTTHDRGTITIASGNQKDVFEDRVLQRAHESFVRDADRLGGFIDWPLPDDRSIGLYIYTREKEDQRIGIDAQAQEEDIRSVLQDIRRYSS